MATSERVTPALEAEVPRSRYVGQRMTLEEFLKLPEEKPYLELIDGVVRQKVAAKPFHGRLQFKLCERLNSIAEERGLGIAFTETRFSHTTWAPVPDVALYTWERLPLQPDGTLAEDFAVQPDLAVEIVSPGQRLGDLIEKCAWYVENGVRVALLIHPDERAVFAFRPGAQVRVLRGGDRIDLDDVVPGFELTVEELFSYLRPRRPATTAE